MSPGDFGANHSRAGRPTDAGWTPALHLIAVLAVAAVTPIHPGKAALIPYLLAAVIVLTGRPGFSPAMAGLKAGLPFVFLLAALFVRWSLVPILVTAAFALLVPYLDKLEIPVYAAALALLALWPWSGVVARALPVVTRYQAPAGEVRMVGLALARGQTATIDGLQPVRHVTVIASAANAAQLPRGRVIGYVNDQPIRIGDVADFGFTRRPHFFSARNPLPRFSRADIRGYGATAWVHGAGAIGVAGSASIRTLHFRAADDLPAGARLQIESVELPAR